MIVSTNPRLRFWIGLHLARWGYRVDDLIEQNRLWIIDYPDSIEGAWAVRIFPEAEGPAHQIEFARPVP